MNDAQKEMLLSWLNDAYAMENSIAQTLERQADHFSEMPEAQAKILAHKDMTEKQAERVKECIEELDGSISNAKSMMSDVMGAMQGMSTSMADDKMVKDVLAQFATEHFEIACYTSLKAGAQEMGQEKIVQVCEQILKEEEEMAAWVEMQIPVVTKKYLTTL